MDLSSYDLEYLRPPFEASFINHNIDYIKSGSGINAKRRIFYNVSFESDELKAIQELESFLQSQGVTLPEEWNQSETLKFLYAQKFNKQAAAETIQTCLEWRDDPQTSLIDDSVLQYLEAGVIYVYGLDHQFRPILIINLNKLRHLQIDEDTFKIALVIVMDVIRTYCFLPRKIENCVILIDAQGVKTIDPDNIKAISYLLRSCFPSTFERIILITSPNFKDSHFQLIHSVANKEELEDVQIISSTDLKGLQTFIPAEHLEKKYGGECPTVEKFWPPPKRNELYHRTSVTSLKQYSEAGSIGNIPKENLSALSKSGYSAKGNVIPESELKQYTFADNPRTPQSVQSEMFKLQPNQLGGVPMTQSESFMKKSVKASPFDQAENLSQQKIPSNTKVPSQNDLRFKSEENLGRNTAPIQPGSNQESPSKKYKANDPFARVRNEEAVHSGRTNLSVVPHNNNNNGINLESADRFVIRETEAPKAKRPVSHWDMKMEPTSLHKQLSSQASEIDSQSRGESPIQGKRKMLPTTTVTPTHRRESSQPGDLGNRVSYAVYGGGGSNNKPGMGYQNEVDNGNMRPQQRNGRTFEENEVDTPSMASYTGNQQYSQQEKEKVKKRLVEISAKKAEESDEEDAKSKKGLFCGCCVGTKKKDTLLRSKSQMKKSKYDY